MALYGSVKYWDERYLHSGPSASYEWLQTYSDLRHLLSTESLASTSSSHKTHLNCYAEDDCDATASSNNVTDSPPYFPSYEDCRVLILGCGNSTFAEDMRDDGWCGPIVNIDFSTVVIDQMKKRYEERGYNDASDTGESAPKTSFVCADITEGFPFEAESFDLVIMKGTLDAILCSNGGSFSAKDVVTECARVLSTGYGCLFLVSHSNPDGRVEFLEYENNISHYWQSVSIHNLPRHGVHIGSKTTYAYICRKRWDAAKKESDQAAVSKLNSHSFEENIPSSLKHPTKAWGSELIADSS